jgi:hypothetical protein
MRVAFQHCPEAVRRASKQVVSDAASPQLIVVTERLS